VLVGCDWFDLLSQRSEVVLHVQRRARGQFLVYGLREASQVCFVGLDGAGGAVGYPSIEQERFNR
jgi:hypothetical protein